MDPIAVGGKPDSNLKAAVEFHNKWIRADYRC